MTLDEAIKHAEEVAENKEKAIKLAKGNPDHPMLSMSEKEITEYKKCINEHRQLAEWLRDYKRLKEQEPCEDAISRAELTEALNTWDKFGYAPTNELIPLRGNMDKDKYVPYIHYDDVIKCIKGMRPVTPQPKIGYWIRKLIRNEKGGCIGAEMICSKCGEDNGYDKYMNYCPNCGAKMLEIPTGSEGSDKG